MNVWPSSLTKETALVGAGSTEPCLANEGDKRGAGLLIAREAMNHFDVPLAIFLAYFIGTADEATLAMALEAGREQRDKQHAERRASLRIVT